MDKLAETRNKIKSLTGKVFIAAGWVVLITIAVIAFIYLDQANQQWLLLDKIGGGK